jgi:nicotinate-nucleotide adenylyltransferase
MRIGLLGGSFNPIHNAHLHIAEAAQEECLLEKVIFIPAAYPPHKLLAGEVSFKHRAAMVSLAIAGSPAFEMSPVEAERGGTSYSIDTIRTFRQRHPDDELFFIIGGDSFRELGTWHRYAEIFIECNLIVLERPGCHIDNPLATLPEAVRDEFCHNAATSSLVSGSGKIVHFVTGTPQEISSTEIRRRAATGADITPFVPPDVAAYISQQRIYHQWLKKK